MLRSVLHWYSPFNLFPSFSCSIFPLQPSPSVLFHFHITQLMVIWIFNISLKLFLLKSPMNSILLRLVDVFLISLQHLTLFTSFFIGFLVITLKTLFFSSFMLKVMSSGTFCMHCGYPSPLPITTFIQMISVSLSLAHAFLKNKFFNQLQETFPLVFVLFNPNHCKKPNLPSSCPQTSSSFILCSKEWLFARQYPLNHPVISCHSLFICNQMQLNPFYSLTFHLHLLCCHHFSRLSLPAFSLVTLVYFSNYRTNCPKSQSIHYFLCLVRSALFPSLLSSFSTCTFCYCASAILIFTLHVPGYQVYFL